MTISRQVFLSFLVILASIVAIAWLGLYSISKLEESYKNTVEPPTKIMIIGSKLNQDLLEHMLLNHKLFISPEDKHLANIMELRQTILQRYNQIKDIIDQEDKVFISQFKESWDSYIKKTSDIDSVNASTNLRDVLQLLAIAQSEIETGQVAIKNLVDKNERDVKEILQVFKNEYQMKKNHHIIISIIAVIIAMFFSALIARRFDKSIGLIKKYTRTLAQGDYSHTLQIGGHDEVSEIIDALNKIPMSQSFKIDHLKDHIFSLESNVQALCDNTALKQHASPEELSDSLLQIKKEITKLKDAFNEYMKT